MACPTFHMPLSKNRVPLKIPAVYHVLPSCSPLRYTCWLILIYHIRRYIPIMPLYMALKLGGHPSGWLHSRESESLICSFHRRRIMYRWTVGWFSAMPKIVISQFIAFYHAPKWLLFFWPMFGQMVTGQLGSLLQSRAHGPLRWADAKTHWGVDGNAHELLGLTGSCFRNLGEHFISFYGGCFLVTFYEHSCQSWGITSWIYMGMISISWCFDD